MFIPLKRKWFEAFERGEKISEWRRYSRRWDETACRIGRRVVLSLGYSGPRLYGTVTGYRRAIRDSEIYGPGADVAEIDIRLD
jgi:hypothetical protein